MNAAKIAERYYAGFTNGGDFASVPMADDLTFAGPMMTIDSAAEFRQVLSGLSTKVKSLKMRRQVADDDLVISVYDFDMGAGPLPMAEVLSLANGKIHSVELIFDQSKMAAAG